MKKILLFLLAFLACTSSVKAEWYVVGDFTSWNSSKAFTDNGDGTFTLDYEGTITTSQGFKIYNGSWGNSGDNDSNIFGVSSDGGTVTIGTACHLANPGFNMKLASEVTNPRFVFNPSAKTLLVTAEGSTGDSYPDIYLRGDFNSWGTGNMFVNNGDGTYSMTVADASTLSGQFKLASEDWSIEYTNGAKDGEKTIGIGETLYLYSNSDKKKSTFKSMSGAVTIDLKYIDNSSYVEVQMTISEQGTTPDPTYPDLWVRGDFNNWGNDGPEANTAYKFTCTGGVYTLNDVRLSNNQFKIGTKETEGDWMYGFGAAYGATDVLTVTADGKGCPIYDVKGGENLYIGEVTGNVDITFTPNFTAKTGILTIAPHGTSGINDVEIFDEAPVEFYNLQGVRVDGELTPGLYIRRQGGNASKILIR